MAAGACRACTVLMLGSAPLGVLAVSTPRLSGVPTMPLHGRPTRAVPFASAIKGTAHEKFEATVGKSSETGRRPAYARLFHSLQNETVWSAVALERRALLQPRRIYLPMLAASAAGIAAARGAWFLGPIFYVAARAVAGTAGMRRAADASADMGGVSVRLFAETVVRCVVCALTAAMFLSLSLALAGLAAVGRAARAVRASARRRAMARQAARDGSAAAPEATPPSADPGSARFLSKAGLGARRTMQNALGYALLALMESIWACEAAFVLCTRLWVVGGRLIAGGMRTLRDVEWGARFEEARAGLLGAAVAAGAAVASLPETVAYQLNFRGLQFENFLASTWVRSSRARERRLGNCAGLTAAPSLRRAPGSSFEHGG